MTDLGKQLRDARANHGLTQPEMAAVAGVCREVVCAVENGHDRFTERTRRKLRNAIERLELGDSDSAWVSLGRGFRLLRLGSGVTLVQLARRLNIPLSAVEALEAGNERIGEKYEQVGRHTSEVAGDEREPVGDAQAAR